MGHSNETLTEGSLGVIVITVITSFVVIITTEVDSGIDFLVLICGIISLVMGSAIHGSVPRSVNAIAF